jgi:hypothetical protein
MPLSSYPAAPFGTTNDEEHELPTVEAVLAGTLALMTGYSQTLQADQHPQQRLFMGEKIGRNLALLAEHPALSEPFHHVVLGLRSRWLMMSACTQAAGGSSPMLASTALDAPTMLQ